jgi:hypothetical protein
MSLNVMSPSLTDDAVVVAVEGQLDLLTDERVPFLPTLESAKAWLLLQQQEPAPIGSPRP